jgi:HEAT repeat protein
VRRETVNALANIGTEEAQTALGALLDDKDERIRLRVLQSLNAWEAWRAMPKLLTILERRDWLNRQFALKAATLEALARLGAKQSLPIIKKMASNPLLLGRRGRELRRLAGVAASIIEGGAPIPAEGLFPPQDTDADAL